MKPVLLEAFHQAGIDLFIQDGQLMAGVRKGCAPSAEVIAKARAMKAEIMEALQKPEYPSIWDVVIQTHGKLCPMVVIDPTHEDEATFRRELVERFGLDRLVSVRKRNGENLTKPDIQGRYAHKQKSQQWFQSGGLQLPNEGITAGTKRPMYSRMRVK